MKAQPTRRPRLKKLFEGLVLDEERHYDQYNIELDKLAKFGEKELTLQSIERSRSVTSGTKNE